MLKCVDEGEEGEMGMFERVGYYVYNWGYERMLPALGKMMGLGWGEKFILV